MKKQSRIDFIDILRFVFIIFILYIHFMFIFTGGDEFKFRGSYIFVEAFLFITGYFTASHFSRSRIRKLDKKAKASLSYTFKKFSTFIPYIIVGILFGLFFHLKHMNGSFVTYFIEVAKIPVDLLFGSAIIYTGFSGPLWYSSALFLAFPLLCLIIQNKNYKNIRNLVFLISIPLFICFTELDTLGIGAIIRVFFDLLIGATIFDFAGRISKIRFNTRGKVLLQIIETLSFAMIIYVISHSSDIIRELAHVKVLVFASLIIFFTLIFSRKTFTSQFKAPFIRKASTIILPAFLIHEPIACIMMDFRLNLPSYLIFIIYIAVTFVISSLLVFIVSRLKKLELKKLELKKWFLE